MEEHVCGCSVHIVAYVELKVFAVSKAYNRYPPIFWGGGAGVA